MRKYVGMILAVACFAVVAVCSCGKEKAESSDSAMPDRGPHIRVAIDYPNASCIEVESALAQKVEKVLMTCAGRKIVATSCRPGLLIAKVYFERNTDIDASLDAVYRKMQSLRGSLPADVGEGSVSVVGEESPVITVDVYGDSAIGELIDAAEKLRTAILADLPDYVTAGVTGQKETHVNLQTFRMVQHALTAGQVLESIRSLAEDVAPDELASMVIDEPVLLKDIATFSQGFAGPTIRVDGMTCAELRFYAPSKYKAIAAARGARKSADIHRSSLPKNMQSRIYRNAGGTTTGPVRLSVLEINPGFAPPLVLELEKLEVVESIRSVVSERDSRIELTMKPDVQFQEAIELIREKCKSEVLAIESLGLDGRPMQLRQLPEKELLVAVERLPAVLLGRIDIFGSNDNSALRKVGDQVLDQLREIEGVGSVDMKGSLSVGERTLRPKVDMRKLAYYGVSVEKVLKSFGEFHLLNGAGEVVEINGGSDIVRIFCRDKNITDLRDIVRQPITTKDGRMIPLDVLMEVDSARELQEITRINGIRVGSMDVYSDGTCDTDELIRRIRSVLDNEMGEAIDEVKARLFVE